MAKNILNASALNTEVKTEVKTPAINDGVHFVIVSFASRTTDTEVGVIKGTALKRPDGTPYEFECNVAVDTSIPPISKQALERLQEQGFYTTYLAPIQGRTAYDVTVTEGKVTKIQRLWTDAELEQMKKERVKNALSDYARFFEKGGKQ